MATAEGNSFAGNTFFGGKDNILDGLLREDLFNCTSCNLKSAGESDYQASRSSSKEQLTNPGALYKANNLENLLTIKTSKILEGIAAQVSKGRKKIDTMMIGMIIDVLVSRVAVKFKEYIGIESLDEFSCASCLELLYDPVTLICGHSFCKICILNLPRCKECKSVVSKASSLSVNVIMTQILQKWHPTEYVGRSLTVEGDKLMKENRIQEAILKYMDAMEFVPESHVVCNNRAKAFAALGNTECAIEDASRAGSLSRQWPEAHFVKGEVLEQMGAAKEALFSFLVCLSLDPTNALAKRSAKKIAFKILSTRIAMNTTRKRKYYPDDDCDESYYMPVQKDGQMHWNQKHKILDGIGAEASLFKWEDERGHTFDDILSETQIGDESMSEHVLNDILMEFESHLTSDFDNVCEVAIKEDSSIPGNSRKPRAVDQSLVDSSDFECSLCMRVYFLPVCTPCGHTFCRDCIERCIDYSMPCPLCKAEINKNILSQKLCHPKIDVLTEKMIKVYLTEEYEERLTEKNEEINQLKQSVPIFVCTLAFPSVACPLHIYEPRYRLMLRRVLDIHNREFGICSSSQEKPFQEIGTILKVRKATFFPDGRSVVESVGSKRFEVIHYGSKDGYDTAKVEYIIDEPVVVDKDIIILKKLMNLVYAESQQWYQSVETHSKDQINTHFGGFPTKDDQMGENGPDWAWWVLAVLPVEDKMKLSILRKKLLRERLILLHRVLACLKKRREQSAGKDAVTNS